MGSLEDGRIIRLRNFRDYGPDGKSWIEYSCRKESDPPRQKIADKEVFVAMLLGVEKLVLPENTTPEMYWETIDGALARVGYMSITDALAAGADPAKFKFELVDNEEPEEDTD